MGLFSKKTAKKHQHPYSDNDDDDDYDDDAVQSPPDPPSPLKSPVKSSPAKSPSKSPTKSTSAKASPQKPVEESPSPASASPREPKQRTSRTFARLPADSGLSRRKKIDPDIHPLNLPPDERKRLSALSAVSSWDSMDIDRDPPASSPPHSNGAPSSPPPAPVLPPHPQQQQQQYQHQYQQQQQHQQNHHHQQQQQQQLHQGQYQQQQQSFQQQSPQQQSLPQQQQSFQQPLPTASFPPSLQNGAPSPMNLDSNAPVPPPHKSKPPSPVPTPVPVPAPTPADDAEDHKAAGNKFFKEKDYRRAIDEYSKAVDLMPQSSTYLSNRAAAYMSAGNFLAALEDCKRAADLDPQNPKILHRLARIYTSLGQPDDAVMTFSRIQPPPSARDMAPAKEMLQHVQAARQALHNSNTGSMVLHALDMAEKLLGPGALKPRAWQLMRGQAYLKMGSANSLGEAANIAMSLLRLNDKDPDAMVLRGRGLYAQGNNADSLKYFRRALDFDPDFKDAVKWLRTVQKLERLKEDGNNEYKAGRWEPAVRKYSDALDVDPANRSTNSRILQNRALAYSKLKRHDAALADCDRALALDPEYTKARRTKAAALGHADMWEDAVREWKALAEKEPADQTIHKELKRAELELKKSLRKDYYKILDVAKDADDKEIKKAYRRLAVVHHPDKNPGDEAAEARFKDIGEAYETLSDPQKRARYDSGEDLVDVSDMFGGGGMPGGMAGGIDPEILFSMMNGEGGGGFRFGNPGGSSSRHRGFHGAGGSSNFQGGFQFP